MRCRILKAIAFSLLGAPLFALCDDGSYLDRLTPIETAQLATFSDMPFGRGTQWTLTRGDKTLTLVGTIHIHDARLSEVINGLRGTIETADLILLEATPEGEAQLQTTLQSDPTALFTQGATLPERLDGDTWLRLMAAANARGLPAPITAKMQPWYLSIILALPPCVLTETAQGKRGLDHLIMQSAIKADVPMQALEPYDTLIKIMQSGTADEQLDMLKLAIVDETTQTDMLGAMRELYFSQDIGSVIGLSRIAATHTPGLDSQTAATLVREAEEQILTKRNAAWMPAITQASTEHDTVLVAVGAAHLVGNDGLLALLEAQGWTINRR